VRRVIDGDTVELSGGQLVRYLGIDTPETRRRSGGRWVHDPEPFGEQATEANRRLVERKTVRLEYDVQTRDRFDRLLAYVYAPKEGSGGGEVFVNEELLRQGYAQPMTIPPNVKRAERFRAVSEEARATGRGLWGVR
jgi:micrococcal nuclease